MRAASQVLERRSSSQQVHQPRSRRLGWTLIVLVVAAVLALPGCEPLGKQASEPAAAGTAAARQRPARVSDNYLDGHNLSRIKRKNPAAINEEDSRILEQLQEKYPEDGDVWQALVDVYRNRSNWNGLVRLYGLQPEAERDQLQFSVLLIKAGRYEEARAVLEPLGSAGSADLQLRLRLAEARHFTGDSAGAAPLLDSVLQELKQSTDAESIAEVYALRGLVALQMEDLPVARAMFENGLQVQPGNLVMTLGLARTLRQLGEGDKAAELEQAAQKVRNDLHLAERNSLILGALVPGINQAMLAQRYDEADRLIDRALPLADEQLRSTLLRNRKLIEDSRKADPVQSPQPVDPASGQPAPIDR